MLGKRGYFWAVITIYISALFIICLANPNWSLTLTPRYKLPAVQILVENPIRGNSLIFGTAAGPIILIYSNHLCFENNSKIVKQHELIHAEQWYYTAGLNTFLIFTDKFLAYAECEAYAYQLTLMEPLPKIGHKGNIDYITDMLVEDYEIKSYSKQHLTFMIEVLYEEFSNVPDS